MQQHVYAISNTCAALGIRHVIICPGSRSAPLVFAFTQNKKFNCYTVIDERSAGYMALGMAQQLQQPVVLICTSGTAALNFYPAIAEAFYQKVPLVVLTADRPPELLYQQDGQMIVQPQVFEKNIRASYALPCYAQGKENLVQATKVITEAFAIANGLTKGPVHINVPLSEPLYPETSAVPLPAYAVTQLELKSMKGEKDSADIKKAWDKSNKKLILIGQLPVNYNLLTSLFELSQREDVVILCDVLSNQQGVCTASCFDFILSQANEQTLELLEPDFLISFGGPVFSKSLKLWLKKQKPQYHFRIQCEKELVDTYQHVTRFIDADVMNVLDVLVNLPETKGLQKEQRDIRSAYKQLWELLDADANDEIEKFIAKPVFSELHATHVVLENLPVACNLHLANSSVIRYVSNLGKLDDSWIMNGNRGTSGIDGCTSTAAGAAMINNRQTVLLTGDLAFLYDKNALWNHHVPHNLRIIVLNNNGGGIFNLIDGPSKHKKQLEYFTTPHQQSVKNTALDNDLEYYFCDSLNTLQQQLSTFFMSKDKAAILEVKINMQQSANVFKAFKKIKL